MHWFRKNRKGIARGLLAVAGSLWLVAAAAPCVMAQTHQVNPVSAPCSMSQGMAHTDMADMRDCGPVMAVNCKLPDLNTPLAAALSNLAATPVLLVTLPVLTILPQSRQHPQNDFFTPDIPAPPLHIQHLTLIL